MLDDELMPPGVLPADLAGPVAVALARAAPSVPETRALPGGCVYELKWDGFRLVVVTTKAGSRLWTRQGTASPTASAARRPRRGPRGVPQPVCPLSAAGDQHSVAGAISSRCSLTFSDTGTMTTRGPMDAVLIPEHLAQP